MEPLIWEVWARLIDKLVDVKPLKMFILCCICDILTTLVTILVFLDLFGMQYKEEKTYFKKTNKHACHFKLIAFNILTFVPKPLVLLTFDVFLNVT